METVESRAREDEIDGLVKTTQKEMLKKWDVLKKNGYDVKNYLQYHSLPDNSCSSSTISRSK